MHPEFGTATRLLPKPEMRLAIWSRATFAKPRVTDTSAIRFAEVIPRTRLSTSVRPRPIISAIFGSPASPLNPRALN